MSDRPLVTRAVAVVIVVVVIEILASVVWASVAMLRGGQVTLPILLALSSHSLSTPLLLSVPAALGGGVGSLPLVIQTVLSYFVGGVLVYPVVKRWA